MTVGVDVRGTSVEGLESLRNCLGGHGEVRVFHNNHGPTFHPKMYVFSNNRNAEVIIGSGNLTRGGLFENYEASIALTLDLTDADDHALFTSLEVILDGYSNPATPTVIELTDETLERLCAERYIIPEAEMRPPARRAAAGVPDGAPPADPLFRHAPVPPAPPVPAIARGDAAPRGADEPRGLAIQIRPHDNGEIFLSVMATRQNPAFFGLPFTGRTTPKKAGNEPYPQRDPDPIVNFTVRGAQQEPTFVRDGYPLNTVYYERNSEIRITAAPLVPVAPEGSIMILEPSEAEGVDYEITIHRPDSPEYKTWLDRCDQRMPGGGQTPRRFGWF